MARTVRIWTWDAGEREVDMDGDEAALARVLQTVLDGGLWGQFRKFPPDVLLALAPRLVLAPQTRRLIEMWVEEAQARAS